MLGVREIGSGDIQSLLQDRISTYPGAFDISLEEIILSADTYGFFLGDRLVGYCCVGEDGLLCQFSIRKRFAREGWSTLEAFIKEGKVHRAYVLTFDSYFLSVAMDFQKSVSVKARIYSESERIKSALRGFDGATFRHGRPEDADRIKDVSGDFVDRLGEHLMDDELFILEHGGEILGIGVAEDSLLQPGYASVGMFVNEKYRRKGVGAYLVSMVSHVLHDAGVIPIAGGWMEADEARSTMVKAGFAPMASLLEISFT